jgi:hypothetical protein
MAVPSVSRPEFWTHARRKSDGKPFYLIPGSTPGAVYYTAEDGCTCPSAQHSRTGTCKHQLAVSEHQRSQRPTPSPKPRVSYEDLFPACPCGDIAEHKDGLCDRCASAREYSQRMAARRAI